MFEILKALMALSEAAGPNVRTPRMRWAIDYRGADQILRVEIPLTEDEAEFAEQMRLLLAPADEN